MKTFLKSNEGFTLIELLASVIVLVAIGSVVAGIIASSLRSTNKTNTIENIRQNGNYVINQMSKDIGFAQVFNGFSMTNQFSDYHVNCPESFDVPTPIPNIKYNYLKVTSLNGSSITYHCSGSTLEGSTLAVSTTPVDGSQSPFVSLVGETANLSSCSLTCTQLSSTDVPTVGISFTLEPKNKNGLVENSSPPITFQTSVAIRNYSKE